MANNWIIRYGSYRMVGEFEGLEEELSRGDFVILQTDRGTETGQILCKSDEKSKKWLSNALVGKIIRKMTSNDQTKSKEIKSEETILMKNCAELASRRGVRLTMVDSEKLFGGERIIFYYLAEGRIDFRELVKDLAREFHTRIEMRQIGVRDEAKLLADLGDCGQPVCCNSHLVQMPPVTMRMAKMQKATMDPNKISGRCGRLKCCLRYEQDVYDLYQKDLPEPGAVITTEKGRGKVLAQEILSRKILVEFEDGRRLSVPASDILDSKE